MKRGLSLVRRLALPAAALAATFALAAAIWAATGSLVATILAAVGAGGALAVLIVGLARAGRAIRQASQRAREADKAHATEISRVLYHARRGADAAVAARGAKQAARDAALERSIVALRDSAAQLAGRVDALPSDRGASVASAAATRPDTALDRRPVTGLAPGWALERQFDIASGAPHVLSANAPRALVEVSSGLQVKLATAAALLPPRSPLLRDGVDFVIVSDAGTIDGYGLELTPQHLVDAMLSRLSALAAMVHDDAARVLWLETELLGPREIEQLESACDALVLPPVEVLGAGTRRITCDALLDLRAMEAHSPSAPSSAPTPIVPLRESPAEAQLRRIIHRDTGAEGTAPPQRAVAELARLLGAKLPDDAHEASADALRLMRSLHLWTPRRLLGQLGEIVGKPQPSTSAVTLVARVSSHEQAGSAGQAFRAVGPSVAERLLLVVDAGLATDRAMGIIRAFGSSTTVVTPMRELTTREGRAGLIDTAYAVLMPPHAVLDADGVASALAVAEASLLPIAIAAAPARATLCDRTTTPLLMSAEHALRAVHATDRLTPARALGAA